MFQPVNNTPEELLHMENLVDKILDWSKDQMHHLVDTERVEDATALYEEFCEWYDPLSQFEVVVIDDMFGQNINTTD